MARTKCSPANMPRVRESILPAERLMAVNRGEAEDVADVLESSRVDDLFAGLDYDRVSDEAGSFSALAREIWRLFLVAMLISRSWWKRRFASPNPAAPWRPPHEQQRVGLPVDALDVGAGGGGLCGDGRLQLHRLAAKWLPVERRRARAVAAGGGCPGWYLAQPTGMGSRNTFAKKSQPSP